jgi:hypothetical protein
MVVRPRGRAARAVLGAPCVAACSLLYVMSGSALPLAAQDSTSSPHGFISTRYDTHTSSNLYAGYALGPVTAMFALVSNPRSGYREENLGLVRGVTVSRKVSFTFAVAGSKAIDSWYGQLYILPNYSAGPFTANATFELYAPLQSVGVWQFAMNPGNVFVDVGGRFRVGAVGVVSLQQGAGDNTGFGPSVQFRIPKGTITFDWVVGATRWVSESRVSFFTAY